MTAYEFIVSCDILAEAGATLPNLALDVARLATVLLRKRGAPLSEAQLATVKTKLEAMFNAKLGLSTCRADLDTVRSGIAE